MVNKKNDSMILHIDGDAFFATCEMAQFPSLRGKAVVVGEERGIAVAMSHEAKKLGITRAMPIFKIKRNFPEVNILPSHFELYESYNKKMLSVLRRFTANVEEYSIDECFALLSSAQAEKYGGREAYVRHIKNTMQSELGITFSFGLAKTKVLAKVASNYQKPDGFTYIKEGEEKEYLKKVPIGKVWGIGYRTAPKLALQGIKTAYDFVQIPRSQVERRFSKPFQELWHELRGVRIFDVYGTKDELPKSLQATRTFTPASADPVRIYSELSKNIETACTRMRRFHLATNHIYIYLKTSEFKYRSAEIELPMAVVDPSFILEEVEKIFPKLMHPGERYRATGVTVSTLIPKEETQKDLFGLHESHEKKSLLSRSLDEIRSLYGNNIIFLASSLPAIKIHREKLMVRQARDSFILGLPFPYLGEVI